MPTWTSKDEAKLRYLIEKRRKARPAQTSHDIEFATDLLRGEDGEKIVLEALETAEVKRDFGAGNTGNIFVEHESRGKPSGIETTQANWYIYLLGGTFEDEVFIGVRTARLKRILDSIKWQVRGGDNKTSRGKLIRLTKLLKNEVIREAGTGVDKGSEGTEDGI